MHRARTPRSDSIRRHAQRAAAARWVLAAASVAALIAPAAADRMDTVVALGKSGTATVTSPNDVATVGFLVAAGTKKKLQITVKAAKRSTLRPDVVLIDPSGAAVDPAAIGGSVKAGTTSWVAKLPDVPAGGLWRLEIRGETGTSGAATVLVKGKDVGTAKGVQTVPSGAFLDLPIDVGANQTLTVTARRGPGSRVIPRLRILDPNGVAISDGAFLGATNTRSGSLSLKAFRLPNFGRYTLRFSGDGTSGGLLSYSAKTAPAKIKGAVPVANPGGASDTDPGDATVLNGSASTGSNLQYRWVQVGGDRVELTGASTSSPTFVAPQDTGSVAFELAVGSGGVWGVSVPVAVEVTRRPLADAGRSRQVDTGAAVTLDGSGSYDRRGTGLAYAWRQHPDDTTKVTLTGADTAAPTFTAPASATTLRFLLAVDDGAGRSPEDQVTVVVGGAVRPVADAGRPQIVPRMATVHLCGMASTVPSGLLGNEFTWTQLTGPAVVLDNATSPFPAFTAPRFGAELTFEARVAGDDTTKDVVRIRVLGGENGAPPVARGNGSQFTAGGIVSVAATNTTDPNSDPMTFLWAQTAGPGLPLASQTNPANSVVVPAGNETRSYLVMANDRLAYGAPDLVHVRNSGYSGKPVANAGNDVTTTAGQLVQLLGSNSGRTTGSGPVAHRWRQVSGRDWFDVDASDPGFIAGNAVPVFRLPVDVSSLTPRRTITFELVVNDGTQDSDPDLVTVSFTNLPTNGLPIVQASASEPNPIAGQSVTLNAVVSDRDGDPVTVRWQQTAGSPAPLSSTTSLSPTFTAPASGILQFRVTPNDGFDNGPPVTVTVTVNSAPTARALASPAFGPPGTLVTIDGIQSSDPEGNLLTYSWTQTAGPSVTFTPTNQSFQFTSVSGTYTFRLVVNDGRQNSPAATVSFSGNAPPTVAPTAGSSAAPYGSSVSLAANGGGGGALTFRWRQIREGATASDPLVTLASTTGATTSFTVPTTTSGPLGTSPSATFGVIANNGGADSPEGTVKVTFYASFDNNSGGAAGSGAPSTSDTVYSIMSSSCGGSQCHNGSSTSCSGTVGYGFLSSASTFISNNVSAGTCNGGKGSVRISAGSAANSYFYQRLTGQASPQMPSIGSLQQKQIDLIKDWIDQGAKNN